MSRLSKVFAFASLVILVVATVSLVRTLQGLEGWTTRVPQWDPSAHALDSIHFARAFRHMSLPDFFVQLHNSAMWPPVIPLMQAPFQFFGGESILVARNWTAWMAVPALTMVFLVGLQSHARFGAVVGSLSATLLAISPLFQEHCLQEMFEVPGIFLCMVTLFFYLKYLNTSDPKHWRYTCLAGIILFFAKFNYAVLIMLPVVVCEFVTRDSFRQLLVQGLKRFASDVNWRGGFTLFVALYAVFLVYVQKVGIRFEVFSQTVVIEKAFGNPLYILACILLLRNWLKQRILLKGYVKAIWSAPEPFHSLLRIDILPALVWLSYPVFFLHFFLYMFNEKTRQASFWSWETLSFYPGSVIHEYSPNPVLGAITLASLGVMLLFFKKLPKTSRFLTLLALFNLLSTMLHPNYQVRYLMTFIPLLYLLCGLLCAHILEAVSGGAEGRLFEGIALALAPGLALVLHFMLPPDRHHLQEAFIRSSQTEDSRELFKAICRESKDTFKNTVVGFSNSVSPSSIALTCYDTFPEILRKQLPTAMGRLGFPNEKSGKAIVRSGGIDRFFVVDYSRLGFSPGRLQESFLLEEIKSELKVSSYQESLLVDQGEGGLRLTVFRKPNAPWAKQ